MSTPRKSKGKQLTTDEVLDKFRATDAGNGELFAYLFKDRVLFDHQLKRWLFWDETRARWQPDAVQQVRLLAKEIADVWHPVARELSHSDNKRDANVYFRWAAKSESASGIDATLRQAQAEPPIRDKGDGWDADPWRFGVANGIVDLRTGKFRAGTQTDRITKFSPVSFDPSAKCPRWEQFVSEIFGGDEKTTGYVQQAIGYTLTGSVREQCLFACWGSGGNGKSTLLGIIYFILGDYACDLMFSSLEEKEHRIGDGVKLMGARFAKAIEVRENAKLDEARVKSLTGGDTVTVRPLHRHEISFLPTHKLWLSFNFKPKIRDDSDAMWRRMRLIPFTRKFAGQSQDLDLEPKLRAESAGILNWIIDGCLSWQKAGCLKTPPAIEQATSAYEDESDHLAEFLEECCVRDPQFEVRKRELRQCYENWCAVHRERPKNRPDFSQAVRKHFRERSNGAAKFWVGLDIRWECLPDPTYRTKAISQSLPIGKSIEKETEMPRNSVSSVSGAENTRDTGAVLPNLAPNSPPACPDLPGHGSGSIDDCEAEVEL